MQAVLFDFGGVLAEEGFREGLKAIAWKHGADPEPFYNHARRVIYECGYALGRNTESAFWNLLRKQYPLNGSDAELRREILSRFHLRPRMMQAAACLKDLGFVTAVLSDQTNWLDEIELRQPFGHHFHRVFNSYYLHQTKRMPETFHRACSELGVDASRTLFLDDSPENCSTARKAGVTPIHVRSQEQALGELEQTLGTSIPPMSEV